MLCRSGNPLPMSSSLNTKTTWTCETETCDLFEWGSAFMFTYAVSILHGDWNSPACLIQGSECATGFICYSSVIWKSCI